MIFISIQIGPKYLVIKSKKTIKDAEKHCKKLGYKLFEPKNKKANDAVTKIARKHGCREFWIGLHDRKKEGKFVYLSNHSRVVFKRWARGEPNNGKNNCHGDEDCVVVYNGYWKDICCGQRRGFVCEKSKLFPKIMTISTIP